MHHPNTCLGKGILPGLTVPPSPHSIEYGIVVDTKKKEEIETKPLPDLFVSTVYIHH